MKIWVTGGSGMLGSAIVRALGERRQTGEVCAPGSSEVDLRNADCVREFISLERPDMVIHAAGRVGGIAANIADPVRFLTENMTMGMNVIQGALESGVPQLLNIGSSCMYPRDHDCPLVEDDVLTGPLEPTNEGYALAKIACDRLCTYVATTTGRAYKTIIPSNLYGPGDHFDEQRGHLVANAIRKVEQALNMNATHVEVWGDGTARREFTYVEDVALWIAQAALTQIERLPARVNVGAGVDYTVREYYERVSQACGYSGALDFDLDKPVGMKRKLMDSSLAARFGWTALTGLDEGLARTVSYFRAISRQS